MGRQNDDSDWHLRRKRQRKSTLADALANRLGDRCLVIQQDCYYRDHPDLSFTERAKLNYDEPGIFDHDLLLHDMNTLISGQPITRKAYDYTQHRRADTDELIYPHDVVILEGIHCFFDPRLMKLMFLKLYMKVDADICLLRRIERDILERGRSIDSISDQYRATVRPMFSQYIANYVEFADIIVAAAARTPASWIFLPGTSPMNSASALTKRNIHINR